MSRELTSHKVNGLNEALCVEVMDGPGPGGASHWYHIGISHGTGVNYAGLRSHTIEFQCGPIQEAGVNGISNEALLAIVEDRLVGFQSGEYACRENAIALTKIQEALMWLQKRTRDRIARGVEGTSEK